MLSFLGEPWNLFEGQGCWLGCSALETTVLVFAWCCILLYEVCIQSLSGCKDLGKSFEVLCIRCYLPCFYHQGLVGCCLPYGGQVNLCFQGRNNGFDGSLSGCQDPILWPGFSRHSTCSPCAGCILFNIIFTYVKISDVTQNFSFGRMIQKSQYKCKLYLTKYSNCNIQVNHNTSVISITGLYNKLTVMILVIPFLASNM